MMAVFLTRIAYKTALVLTAAFCFSAHATNASFAFSSEAQQQCTGYAFRLCGSEIPNVTKITACMIKQRASLSTGCRGVMDKESAAKTKVAAQ